MDIRVLSWYLLIPQLGSIFFLLMVIIRQIGLLNKRVQKEVVAVRWTLLGLALAILFLDAILLMVSIVTVLGLVTRSTSHINTLGVEISAVYNGIIFLASLLIWVSYRLAGKISLIVQHEKEVAVNSATGVE